MRYFNAVKAGRALGISDKTIRRYIEKGRIKAIRKESGELAIAESEVEKLRREIEQERLQFGESRLGSYAADSTGLNTTEMSRQVETLEARIAQLEHQQPEITVLTRELGKLAARCDVQQAHIEELERRIASLESRDYPGIAQNVPTPPAPSPTTQNTIPPQEAQKSKVEPNRKGMLSASDFAMQLGIKYDDIKNYMRRGVNGEMLDFTEVQHATRAGYSMKYFTVDQQQKALEVLKRHGKIK